MVTNAFLIPTPGGELSSLALRESYGCTGGGAASAASGLVEARFAGSPLLHITGQTSTAMLDRGFGPVHDVPDQLGMLRSVCKSAYRVHSADSALGLLMHAAAEALTPPMGPVSVEIPIDIQSMTIERPALLDQFALPLPAALSPTPAAMDTLANRVIESKRPLLWTGGGVLPEDHPLVIGPLATLPEFERLYENVDLMLVAGCRLRAHETRDCTMRLPAHRVRSIGDELGAHLKAALQQRGPSLVEVDMEAIGPFTPQHQVPCYSEK